MNLYLFNQKRDRDIDEYRSKLCVNTSEFNLLNQHDKKLLLIGGGYSLLKPLFKEQTFMKITNIDLAPPFGANTDRIENIKEDFVEESSYVDTFDEIWALYSLPLYSPNKRAVYLFVMKSILASKPSGKIRFFPLEYDKSNKLNTRDADFEMTTMECTKSVLEALEFANELGLMITHVNLSGKDKTRIEEAVILSLNFSYNQKKQINLLVCEQMKKYCSINKDENKINVFLNKIPSK